MTPIEALKLLNELAAGALLTRSQHETVVEAVNVIHSVLAAEPTSPVTEKKPCPCMATKDAYVR